MIETLDCGPVHLVGSSYVALLALELAGRRPELVRSVVAHEPPAVELHPVRSLEGLFAGVGAQIAAGDPSGAARRFFEDAVLGRAAGRWCPSRCRRRRSAMPRRSSRWWPTCAWGRARHHRGRGLPRAPADHARRHRAAWLPDIARAVAGRIGCPLAVIPGAGHTPHHTHPEAFAAVIGA